MNGQYLCLAGSRYHAAFVEQLRQKLAVYRVGYLKFDGMAFGCLDAKHGHPPGDLARQSLARAFINVLETARAVRPDIFLSITTGTWLSPWWLRWADAVFIGGHDYGWSHELPSREDRDAAITYRDGVMFEDFQVHQDQFPLSSLMSVGVIKGNLNLLGGPDESPDAWRHELVMEVGRGIMQTELYISPERLTSDEWDQLARAINWAENHDDTLLNHGTMILGDPRKGEVYGYLHAGEVEALIVVRNPSYRPQAVDLPLAEWCDFVRSQPSMVWELSPERKLLAVGIGQELAGLRVTLEPFEVLMLACRPLAQLDGVAVIGLAYDGGGLHTRWQVPHSLGTAQVIASEPTRLNLDGIGTIQVDEGITWIDVGEPRYCEEQWGALLHTTGAGQRILEASWELDESVAKAELVAVSEWQTAGSGRGWALHDGGAGEPTLLTRSVPNALWEIASVPVPSVKGAQTLVAPSTSSSASLWLVIQRDTRQLAAFSEDLPFFSAVATHCHNGGVDRRISLLMGGCWGRGHEVSRSEGSVHRNVSNEDVRCSVVG